MLFKSQVFTQVSGSIGGTTFSHNRAGMYTRARSIPVNPNSLFQNQVRAGMSAAVMAWMAMQPAYRQEWNNYGANVPTTNKLGDEIFLTGQNWFIAQDTARQQLVTKLGATLPLREEGPTSFDRGDFTTPLATVTAIAGISVAFVAGDDWANEDNAALCIFQGRPQNISRNFYNGPWRLIGFVPGDGTTPPTSPEVIGTAFLDTDGFPISGGLGITLNYSVLRAHGRLSGRRQEGPLLIT